MSSNDDIPNRSDAESAIETASLAKVDDVASEAISNSQSTSSGGGGGGGGGGNGKREREEQHGDNDDDEAEEVATKQLKSSDDSDNTAGGDVAGILSGRSSASVEETHTTDAPIVTPVVPKTESVPATSTDSADDGSNVKNLTSVDNKSDSSTKPASSEPVPSNINTSSTTEKTEETPPSAVSTTTTTTILSSSNVTESQVTDPRIAATKATTPVPQKSDAIAPTNPHITTNVSVDHATVLATTTSALTTQSGSSGEGVDPNVSATISNPEQMVEETGVVSGLYVGRVIGKGGEMIRDLQARSGARIDVDQNVPIGQPRVITYRGTRETVDFAKHLVQMLSTDGVNDSDLPLGNASQEYLIIPAQSVGKVIGRGGEMIRELQSRSQAKIQIDHTGQSGIPADQKQVTITGTHESVVKGKEMVLFLVANPLMDAQQSLNMLIDDKVRGGSAWGSGPPYMNLPNQGINMQPHMAPSQLPGVPQGYGMFGQTPGIGGTSHPIPHGGAQMVGGYPPQQASMPYGAAAMGGYQQIQQPQQVFMGDIRESELLYVSRQFMGRIIGSKGVTINDLQRRSACDIQINQDVPPGRDCEITIKGSRQGIDSAKAMIQEIIEVGPQHPYAGGMGSYGMKNVAGYHGGSYAQQPQQLQQPQYNPYQQQPTFDQGGVYGQQSYIPQVTAGGYNTPMMGGQSYGQSIPQQQHAVPYQQTPYGGGYAPTPQQLPIATAAAVTARQAPPPSAVSHWKAASSPDGQIYYYNERTGETQWEKPPGMP